MHSFFRRLLLIAALLVAIIAMGTIGFYLLEEDWTLFESYYMTLMTITTVGYGEVHPLSLHGRILASFVMLIGVTAVFGSIAILGETLLRLDMVDYFGRRRRNKMLADISGHYIVCGAGRVGRGVVRELHRSKAAVVLIDDREERAKWGTELGVLTLVADATKDESLKQARVETAKGLVSAISSDAENVYVTLSAKVLNPGLHIAARASDEQAEEKLRRAGATTVFTPYSFIGHRLAQSMLRPDVASFLDVASAFQQTSELDLEMEQLRVESSSDLTSLTLDQCNFAGIHGVIVLAIKQQGVTRFNPPGDLRLVSGDVLIAIGERSRLNELGRQLGSDQFPIR